MMTKKRATPTNDKGFTIVELLIALSVLSVTLIMATVILIQIGKLYSKGVNAANLQNTSRNINSDLASALQFSGNKPYPCTIITATTCAAGEMDYPGSPDPNVKIYSYCIGTARYSYVLRREKGEDPSFDPAQVTPHVLWRDTMINANSCDPLNIAVSGIPSDGVSSGPGYDLVPNHMSLTRFKVVEITVDEDNDDDTPSVGSGNYATDIWMAYGDKDLVNTDGAGHNTCNGGAGSQFCSVSHISTTVRIRIE